MIDTNIELLSLDNPMCSTDDIWRGADTERCLSDDLDTIEANIAALQSGKADVNHTHSGYVSASDLQALEDAIDAKADATHSHEGYASSSHIHSNYVSQTDFDSLSEMVDGKADASHTHSNYSTTSHNHNSVYSPLTHSHTASEVGAAASEHNHDNAYASLGHNHNSTYSALEHTHSNYATITSLDELSSVVSGKANSSHNHNGVYDEYGSAASALSSAQSYVDSKIDALVGEGASTTLDTIGEISSAIVDNQDAIDLLNAAIANKANVADMNSHASDTEIHITENERVAWNAKSDFSGNYNDLTNKPTIPSIAGLASETYVNTQIDAIDIPSALSDLTTDSTHRVVTDAEKATWNAKSNFSGSYNDLTNKPSIPSIAGLATETYVDEAVSTKADSGHTHGDIYYTETEVDSLLSAKANATHTHAISDITNLQSTLNGKAATSHGTHVSYSTTAPVMDGTASVGTASTVARSDHKHPTDTSRASQSDLDALETVVAGKAASSHTHTISQISDLVEFTDSEIESLFS